MIIVDGITYNTPLMIVTRKGEILYKYAKRTESGILKKEAIGTYYNYDIQVGRSENDPDDYDALWVVLTDPVNEHTVTMPNTQNTVREFDAYFSNFSDDARKWSLNNVIYYSALKFSIIAINPARTP